ncbi:MAG: metallopeptidase [Planctomycetaceae bacterium]
MPRSLPTNRQADNLSRREFACRLMGQTALAGLGALGLAKAINAADDDASGHRFDPILREIEGWTVHVDGSLLEGEHAEMGAEALKMLAGHLQRIRILIPSSALEKLQRMEIWIERNHPQLHAMQYHPSERWLVDHGHDHRLAKKVHITQAKQLLSRDQLLKHPAVILHELAHAYHDQVLGFEEPRIIAAYEAAKERGAYKEVLLYTGRKVEHYALTNHKEYFAEGTEAYFYRNDFYPFVRAELAEYDTTLHDLLGEVWGEKS